MGVTTRRDRGLSIAGLHMGIADVRPPGLPARTGPTMADTVVVGPGSFILVGGAANVCSEGAGHLVALPRSAVAGQSDAPPLHRGRLEPSGRPDVGCVGRLRL
jgi:hypothetical protein